MSYSFIFTEGSSDSALLTGALTRMGFASCRKLSEIPGSIIAHFPKTFPATGDLLNRVNSYPEVLVKEGHYIAIINTGGFSKLGESLKKSVLLIKDELPEKVIVFVDADNEVGPERFQDVSATLKDSFIDLALSRLGVDGINSPDHVGIIKEGLVDTGVYIWPATDQAGTLERVVLDGIRAEFPTVFELIHAVPKAVRDKCSADHEIRRALDRGFNIDKAQAKMMGAAIHPAANFDVYISKEGHRLNNFYSAALLVRLVEFLEASFKFDVEAA